MPRVDTTARKIDDLLNNDGFLGLERNGNLHRIEALLAQLHGDQLDQVLGQLGAGNRKKLGSQLDSGGIFGARGLSAGERQDLFNHLARDTNGRQLAQFSADLGRGDKEALAQGVANFATAQTKLGYIDGLASQTTRADDATSTGVAQESDSVGSPQANAVATVLGSMRGGSLNKALSSLSDPELRAVMKAAEQETITTTWTGNNTPVVTTSFDTKPLANIINATASVDDVQQKARVFQYGAQALDDINQSNTVVSQDLTAKQQLKQVADSLTHLLASNTTGVVDQLDTDDATGQALISYAGQMLNEGKPGQAQLGRFIAQLRQGNNLKTDPTRYLNTYQIVGGGPYYRHAEDLGYFTGSIEEALLRQAQSTSDQAAVISNIFNAAASAGRTFGPNPVKVAIPVLNGLTQQGINSVVAGMDGSAANERAAFYELALGQDATGHRYRGPAEPFFTTGIVNTAGAAAEAP